MTVAKKILSILNTAKIALAKTDAPAGKKHGLDADLVVSLTSYTPRFPFVYFTLKSILLQDVKPDAVVLWVAEADFDKIPRNVLSLQKDGVEIRKCKDLRSYKKIIPLLMERSNAYIAIADDDVYYPADWLSSLIQFLPSKEKVIFCGRAHRITEDVDGAWKPYKDWDHDVKPTGPVKNLFPTGVGGVVYPPNSLDAETLDEDRFRQLCPTGDDIWLYWAVRRSGYAFQNVYDSKKITPWPLSQKIGLHRENTMEENKNDTQIKAMTAYFGNPL